MSSNEPHLHSILIVEDNAINMMVLSKYLVPFYQVYKAFNVAEALQQLQEFNINCLLMDIEIGDPELDGIGLLQQIRAMPSYVQVCAIAISSHQGEEYEAKITSAGFNAFFSKPIAKAPLLAEIIRLLN